MQNTEIRKLQAPLKEKYRSNPGSAHVTLKAEGKLGESITCHVETGLTLVDAGLHPASGGDGLNVCSGDMLLQARVGCAGVTLSAVAAAMGVEIFEGKISAEGEIDFRGTLAVSKEAPVGFRPIRLSFDLNTAATREQISSLAKLTERYCIVYQTLSKGVAITTQYNDMKSGG